MEEIEKIASRRAIWGWMLVAIFIVQFFGAWGIFASLLRYYAGSETIVVDQPMAATVNCTDTSRVCLTSLLNRHLRFAAQAQYVIGASDGLLRDSHATEHLSLTTGKLDGIRSRLFEMMQTPELIGEDSDLVAVAHSALQDATFSRGQLRARQNSVDTEFAERLETLKRDNLAHLRGKLFSRVGLVFDWFDCLMNFERVGERNLETPIGCKLDGQVSEEMRDGYRAYRAKLVDICLSAGGTPEICRAPNIKPAINPPSGGLAGRTPGESTYDRRPEKPVSPERHLDPSAEPQGTGSQGTGSQGTGSQGTGSQGTGSQGTGSQGTGSQGTGSQGTGSQGTGSQGTGSQGTGSQGTGSQGTGSQGTGSQGTGSQGTGSQGTGSQGTGSQGTGSQGTGSQGTGSQGTGSQGTGSQGTGSQGTGSQGTGSQGTGSQGTGSQGTGISGGGTSGGGANDSQFTGELFGPHNPVPNIDFRRSTRPEVHREEPSPGGQRPPPESNNGDRGGSDPKIRKPGELDRQKGSVSNRSGGVPIIKRN